MLAECCYIVWPNIETTFVLYKHPRLIYSPCDIFKIKSLNRKWYARCRFNCEPVSQTVAQHYNAIGGFYFETMKLDYFYKIRTFMFTQRCE